MLERVSLILLAALGCSKPEHKEFGSRFYTNASTGVVCSVGVDRGHEWGQERLLASLDYAKAHGVVLQTFGHAPTLDLAELADDFDRAAALGIPMVTFRELAAGHTGPGWAFSVDDDEVDTWFGWRDFLKQHHVVVTFFVTRFHKLSPAQLDELKQLVADGHDVEAHGKEHYQSLNYVTRYGLPAYLNDEVLPSRDALTAAGYPPVAFAYAFGSHTHAIDDGLLPLFKLVRTTGGDNCLK